MVQRFSVGHKVLLNPIILTPEYSDYLDSWGESFQSEFKLHAEAKTVLTILQLLPDWADNVDDELDSFDMGYLVQSSDGYKRSLPDMLFTLASQIRRY